MFAIVTIAGFQEKVEEGMTLRVPKLEGEVGAKITFDEVLLVSKDSDSIEIGKPIIAGASVTAEIVEHDRDDKIRVVKFRRRKRYHRVKGHRQDKTVILIKSIKA